MPTLLCRALSAAPATAPSANDVLAIFKTFAPSPSICRIDEHPVMQWVENKDERNIDKRWTLRGITPAMVIRMSDQLYAVQEAGSGKWYSGIAFPPDAAGTSAIACGKPYDSIDALKAAAEFSNLPKAPPGWSVRELVKMPDRVTRVASDGTGKCLFALCFGGDVYRVDLPVGVPASAGMAAPQPKLALVVASSSYVTPGENILAGLLLDKQNHLYVVSNHKDTSQQIYQNRVTIFRSEPLREGAPIALKPWLKTNYPWGVDVFNHGVEHIAQGPDGFLYVGSGSRTDSGETGNDPHISREGETPITACIWRLDPNSDAPKIEVFARGLRNPYGFCWDESGRMIATDNGPNEDPPEELNVIERGGHYGFPYQFADWSKSPYANTPATPAGLKLTMPIVNVGPDGGGKSDKPMCTFDPHSCPTGIVYLGKDFPEPDRGSFLVPRFGPLLDKPKVGFDVLQVRLRAPRGDGRIEAEVKTFLTPVARPVDIHISGGKIYLCEFSRETTHVGDSLALPGRILELAANSPRERGR